jgi:ribosomal protein S18 acetylase RimI-like enzyme
VTPVVTVTDAPSAEAAAVIEGGLARYNAEHAGDSDSRPLAVLVSDPDTGSVIGGILGRTSLGLAFVDLVFLPGEVRGRSVGRTMMREAEDEARRRRCRAVVLYTISFQAPGFYERLGYRRFGEIACDPPGTSRIFFVKELVG